VNHDVSRPQVLRTRKDVPEKELFRRMLLIRLAELRLEALFHLDQRNHPIQLCIGQEAITVGICSLLEADDTLSSRYRSHGHYLARGGSLSGLISELRHRNDQLPPGCSSSLEIVDEAIQRHENTAIFHGGLRLATGIALAQQMKNIFNPSESAVSVVFFSAPMLEESRLYESLHFAAKHRLPLIYVFENNGASRRKARRSHDIVQAMVSSVTESLRSTHADGNDVLSVRQAAAGAISRARAGRGPTIIECASGKRRSLPCSGRYTRAHSSTRCPIDTLRSKLLSGGMITPSEIRRMERALQEEIDRAVSHGRPRETEALPARPPNFIFL